MRLLLACVMPPRPQAWGAIPLVTYAKIAGLRERHDITVVTLTDESPEEREAIEGLRTLGVEVHALRREAAPPHGSYWRLAAAWCLKGWPRRSVWLWEPKLQPLLDRMLATRPFDLINVEDSAMGMYRYGSGMPRVFTEYEVSRRGELMRAAMQGGLHLRSAVGVVDGFRWPRYQRRVWGRFDRIQLLTAQDGDAAARIAPELRDRLRVVPYGIVVAEAPGAMPEEAGSVLFVGSFMHPPNVDAAHWMVDEILPILRRAVPGVRLTIVGDDPRGHLAGLAASDVRITGFVPEIDPYIGRAAVVIAPVRLGGGQRMKVLQSMAMGKAVVTTAIGAAGLAVNGRDLPLIVADDPTGLAAATAALLSSPSTRAELGTRARDFVLERHSAPAYARRMEALYEEARADSRRAGAR